MNTEKLAKLLKNVGDIVSEGELFYIQGSLKASLTEILSLGSRQIILVIRALAPMEI